MRIEFFFYPLMTTVPQDSSTEIPFFNIKVFRDAAITISLSFVGAFLVVVGMIRGIGGFSMNGYIILAKSSGMVSITLGIIISGLGVPQKSKAKHLQAVGLLVWLSGLLNVALGITDFGGFILSSVFVASYIALGGWISRLFANPKKYYLLTSK